MLTDGNFYAVGNSNTPKGRTPWDKPETPVIPAASQ